MSADMVIELARKRYKTGLLGFNVNLDTLVHDSLLGGVSYSFLNTKTIPNLFQPTTGNFYDSNHEVR